MKLSQRVQNLSTSPIRKLAPYANAAKAAGKKVYHLNIGQPDIATPAQFMESIRNYQAEVIAYGDSKGDTVLIKAIQKYYAEVDGEEKCIAQVFGYAVPGPEVYSRDLDGDGVSELICNCIYGTGARRVYIYRNNAGVIEIGRLNYDLWDSTMFPGITNMGSSYIEENYIAETNTFEIMYPTEEGSERVVIEDMDMFEFEEFVEEF